MFKQKERGQLESSCPLAVHLTLSTTQTVARLSHSYEAGEEYSDIADKSVDGTEFRR
jgi:hypothetical protein